MLTLTAVVEAVQLEQITVAELHTLADDITESRDLGDDGGLGTFAESVFAVVHHGAVVIGHAQRAGGGVVVGVEVVLFTFKSCKTLEVSVRFGRFFFSLNEQVTRCSNILCFSTQVQSY